MTTIADPILTRPAEQYLLLDDISWEVYESLLNETTEQHLQLTYDSGRLEIMSPLPKHERVKYLIGAMIDIIALERHIPIQPMGSTTFRRRLLGKGLEPDQCYYIQNESKVRLRDDLDLEVDPPPDLAIEVDVTSRSIERLPLYAALGVPEIWRHDGVRINCLQITDGKYQRVENSLAFSFLSMMDFDRFLAQRFTIDHTSLLLEFRDWVRQGI